MHIIVLNLTESLKRTLYVVKMAVPVTWYYYDNVNKWEKMLSKQ